MCILKFCKIWNSHSIATEIQVFWNVMPCCLVNSDVLKDYSAFIFSGKLYSCLTVNMPEDFNYFISFLAHLFEFPTLVTNGICTYNSSSIIADYSHNISVIIDDSVETLDADVWDKLKKLIKRKDEAVVKAEAAAKEAL